MTRAVMANRSALAVALLALAAATTARAHSPALWPWPQTVSIPGDTVPIDAAGFELACEVNNPCPAKFRYQLDYYAKLVQHSCANLVYPGNATTASDVNNPSSGSGSLLNSCTVQLATSDDTLSVDTNQTYRLTVASQPYPNCKIEADNMYGAYYALTTLAQLCDTSDGKSMYEAEITDFPRFKFRGFLVDSARHFLPVTYLRRVIDVMALHRYNVLHWHLVDSESFPVESKTFPDLVKGAFHPKAVYSRDDMVAVVDYAASRGITVVPEFDVPGHGSWGAGYPDLMGCEDVLDPTKPEVYTFLKTFLQEMASIFPSEYIFLGGDEVDSSCWSKNPSIAQWLSQHNMNDTQLFDYFWTQVTSQVLPGLQGRKVGVWQSNKLDIKPSLLPEGSYGNVWQDPKMMSPVIQGGMPVVFSGSYYLDQQSTITGSGPCKDYAWQQTWKCMYQEEPFDQLDPSQYNMLLGLMTAMWAEGVNELDFETRVWAKAAAVAERMWSRSIVNDVVEAQARLDRHICRLNMMGVRAGPIIPGFCLSDLDETTF
ncbi:beta-hexosaminidase [Chloropicon primus]|uniref:Beta-hexosaminidase n=1 Tax=Chloropicon primus TaxID=1764295 RepID=A0A5B8MG45_9CHLO|nr:beta-hexosaminidase [Chloropicon primus]UPQ98567.1 beta-hexosaminidase [Chloropicon primus]|eukprot:QDZ19357.1 beta-hexosaminidase [Chloropicon primus]